MKFILRNFYHKTNCSLLTAHCLLFTAYCLLFTAYCSLVTVSAQKIAVITPEKTSNSEKVSSQFAEKLKAMDADLVEMAFKGQSVENIYNLSTEEAKTLGRAIGCDFFIILKAENLRRTSFAKPVYFESYLAVYLVSTRTGRLIFWTLKSFEANSPDLADTQLFSMINQLTDEISLPIEKTKVSEINESLPPKIEELPEENSPAAKNFKSPLPFKRMIPVYKRLANLYSITATVDAMVDLDENGKITRIEITRWAGYDLEESVKEVINKMEWRPASRHGKTLPIRVLLRYNFKKVEKDEQ
jgi:Gram-negative bacterial TonB protein C-terminal